MLTLSEGGLQAQSRPKMVPDSVPGEGMPIEHCQMHMIPLKSVTFLFSFLIVRLH